jgi:hypothetical protein
MMMKALTIWQPWASLIMIGAKPHEWRGYAAPKAVQNRRIVIHAGARPVRPAEVEDLLRRIEADMNGTAKPGEATHLDLEKARALLLRVQAAHKYQLLPTSHALGTVMLGVPVHGADLFKMPGADSDRANYNWAWPVSEIEHFEPPIPMRGAQGFFNVDLGAAA